MPIRNSKKIFRAPGKPDSWWAFIYSQATTKKEAREEARKLVSAADGYQIDLPLVMDYELYPKGRLEKFMNGKKYKAAKGTEIAEAFCEVVREAGYEPSKNSPTTTC